jgi:galactose-1-phosphate uridylyltransferase
MRILKVNLKGNILKSKEIFNYLGWFSEAEVMPNGNILIVQNKVSGDMFEYSVVLLDSDLNVVDKYRFPEAFVGMVFRYDASIDKYIGLSMLGNIYTYTYSSSEIEIKCIYINNDNYNADPDHMYRYEDFRLYNGKMIALKKKYMDEDSDVYVETIDIAEHIKSGVFDLKITGEGQ